MTDNKHKGILSGEHPIVFYPSLGKAFGVLGALLIQQVHYWTLVNPKGREGEVWTYNTSEKWAQQLEVYQPETVRKTLRELEKQGVIIVGNFNKRGFDRTHWYRVDYQKLCSILAEKVGGVWQIMTLPSGKKCRMQQAKNTGPIPENIPETNPETVAMLAKDILKDFQGKKTGGPLKEAKGPMDLALLWKKRLGVEGNFVKELTGKDLGQLKLVYKALGGKSTAVLDLALQRWPEFVSEVRLVKGVTISPEKPDIGFFTKFYEVGVAMLEAPPPPQSIAQPPKEVSTTGVAPTPTPATKTSLDEVQKALEELAAMKGTP